MKLSIITANYNNKPGLLKTIESVVHQDFHDYEHIIIDGRSTDGSADLLIEFQDALSNSVSEPDEGVYHAMNKGIRRAKGEYLLFLNSGDYLCNSDTIRLLLKDTPESDLIYGNMVRIFPDGSSDEVQMPDRISADFLLNKTLCHPVTLIKRSLFTTYGLYDEKLRIVADWAFFLKTILLGNVSYFHRNINVAVFNMDGMSASLSSQHFIQQERNQVIGSYFSTALSDLIKEKNNYEYFYNKYRIRQIHENLKYWKKLASRLFTLLKKCSNWFAYCIRTLRTKIELDSYRKSHADASFKIPIIINNRNRLTYLRKLIASLEKRGYRNILILDNDSDYSELLDFYKEIPYETIYLKKNVGYCALWDTPVFARFKDEYYIYTDSDLELPDECPADFVAVMKYFLEKYSSLGKVGLSIITDNIPDHFLLKADVLRMESGNTRDKKEAMLYDAKVDTTLALYRPNRYGDALMLKAARTAFPYSVYHLPWYEDTSHFTPEQAYFYQNTNSSSYWGTKLKTALISN